MTRFLKSKYLSDKRFQISIGIISVILFLVFLILWFAIENIFIQIITFPLAISVSQFFFTPLFRAIGSYKYYSDFLLVYNPNKTTYDLHLGSSFDYLLHMKWSDRGPVAKKKLLAGMLTGLLQIIEEGENDKLPPELIISGTSYFFSDSTVKRFEFQLTEPTSFYRVNILINFLDLYWMSVFNSGSWRFPNLLNPKKAEITLSELMNHKSDILRLQQRVTASK